MYWSSIASNNSLCPVCGGDHNFLVISLENGGGHIITPPFPKAKTTKGKRRATRSDLIDIFWSSEGEE